MSQDPIFLIQMAVLTLRVMALIKLKQKRKEKHFSKCQLVFVVYEKIMEQVNRQS